MPYNFAIPMTSRRRSRFGPGLLIALGLAVISADPALAHNEFVSSSPIDGASLETSPATWDVTFAKEVPLESASRILEFYFDCHKTAAFFTLFRDSD